MNKNFGISTTAKRKRFGLIDYYNLPVSCVLVKQGGLMGLRKFKDTPGTKLLLPSTSAKVYTITDIPLNPEKEPFPCLSGYDVKIDIVMKAEIVDVDLFDRANVEGNVEEHVLEDIKSKIRSFVGDKTYEELLEATHISNIIDPRNVEGSSYFHKVISDIEDNYSIKITSIKFTGIELPDYIKRAKEELQKAEEEKKITLLKANARKEEAEIDRNTESIRMDIMVENAIKFIQKIVPELKKQNWSDEMVKQYVMANLPNAMNIVSDVNSNTSVLDGLNFGIGLNAAHIGQNIQPVQQPVQQNVQPTGGQMRRR